MTKNSRSHASLCSSHEIAVPISRSPQHSWWSLHGVSQTCPAQWMILQNIWASCTLLEDGTWNKTNCKHKKKNSKFPHPKMSAIRASDNCGAEYRLWKQAYPKTSLTTWPIRGPHSASRQKYRLLSCQMFLYKLHQTLKGRTWSGDLAIVINEKGPTFQSVGNMTVTWYPELTWWCSSNNNPSKCLGRNEAKVVHAFYAGNRLDTVE